ncbi:MAG: hypothetical protein COZ21_13675 [Bacteroidetes bacterium CG_4_10_14_3_um_filter_31_20]|nr:MAG: hypothetical protein COZ21_13675 [Bacteroidetes bacterium CG_4_10_14_3_um_filter_31_20]
MEQLEDILAKCQVLSTNDIQVLIGELQKRQQAHSEDQLIRTRKEIIQSKGYQCPNCRSKSYGVHDRTKKYLRLICKSCGKKYSEHTGTAISGLHKPVLWPRFIEFTLEGKSLRHISKELNISLQTAFDWRHKFLSSLQTEQDSKKLSGIVEVDDKEFDISEKGSRKLQRKPYKRPTDRENRLDKDDKLTVMVTVERKSRKSSMKLVKKGRLDKLTLDKELLDKVNKKKTTLCTDAHPTYYGWSGDHDIPHYWIIASKGEHTYKGIYHVQNINSHNSRFETWFRRFNGVASKYLNNYLGYFELMENIKKHQDKFQRTLFEILRSSNTLKLYRSIDKDYKQFISTPNIGT